jgi:hypothetical protein
MDWIHLAKDAVAVSCEHDNELCGSTKCEGFN